VKPVEPVTSTEASNILDGFDGFGAFLANPDEFLHRLPPLVPAAEVTFTNGFPDEFRDSGLPAAGPSVKGIPEMIVEVKLRAPHDVYYTS
jgi:hypothetical protein